jgi:hypothetical protein
MSNLAEEVADRIIREVEAGRPLDAGKWREEITRAHKAATTEAERVLCLGMFKLLADTVEARLRPEALPDWRKVRSQYYNLLLIQEAIIGRTDGLIPPDKMAAITRREVAAGRMSPDDEMHKLFAVADTILKPLPPVSLPPVSARARWMPFIVAITLIALAVGYAAYTNLR